MKTKQKKQLISMFLTATMLVSPVIPNNIGMTQKVEAATTTCTTYSGSNANEQNYSRWAFTIQSYLVENDNNGFMRVQADAVENKILVEYYDTNYNLTETKLIKAELPIFGAFHATDDNYYILSGQTNPNEDNNAEVYRITKYSKDWNKISSCGLYGANTTIPFRAGSARITTDGNYMFIRTCHEMYQSSDGLNHQANVTIQVDMNAMEITDSYTEVMNSGYGYVSHSFNQFIKTENNNIIAVDHGDAYPRSITLIKYNTDFTGGTFTPDYYTKCDVFDIFSFSGGIGDNDTGASIGGFEISDSSYLVAGNSVDQINNFNGNTRNIFVTSTNKTTNATTINWITDYKEGEITTSTPHLVKINNNKFILLWTAINDETDNENTKICYTQLDGLGNIVGDIYFMEGELSDCVPLLQNEKIIWYTWKDEAITFYEINTSDISKTYSTTINNGHEYKIEYPKSGSNTATNICTKCDYTEDIIVPTTINIWWRKNADNGYYSSSYSKQLKKGDTLDIWVEIEEDVDNSDVIMEISDNSIASLDDTESYSNMKRVTMKKAGDFTITIYPRYNPSIKKTFEFNVIDPSNTTTQKPVKVTSLKQKTSYSTSSIAMTWKKVTNASGYEVYQATNKDGEYKKIATTSSTSYTNKKLSAGKNYYFKVRAYKVVDGSKIYGDYSSIVTMATKTKAPTISKVTSTSKQAKVTWKKVTGANGYEIYMSQSKNGTYNKIATTSSKTTSFTKKSLTKGKTYYFKVRAYKTINNKNVSSSWSSIKSVKVK